MIQDILTYTSVIIAISYTIYSFGKTLFSTSSHGKSSTSCGGSCNGCCAKNDLMKHIKPHNHSQLNKLSFVKEMDI